MSNSPSWLKTGAQASQAHKEAQAQAEAAKALRDKMRRFWLKVGDEKTVTFLDGDLDKDGLLQFVAMNEHTVMLNGVPTAYICTAAEEICPLCQDGNRADFVGILTVLNHTPYEIKSGANKGKIITDQRELYVAKQGTLKKLQTLATKRGGLRGWRVEIGRSGDKDPKVGDMFQFLERLEPDALAAKYKDNFTPADYGKELTYLSAKELLEAGVGKAPVGPGFNSKGGGISADELADQM